MSESTWGSISGSTKFSKFSVDIRPSARYTKQSSIICFHVWLLLRYRDGGFDLGIRTELSLTASRRPTLQVCSRPHSVTVLDRPCGIWGNSMGVFFTSHQPVVAEINSAIRIALLVDPTTVANVEHEAAQRPLGLIPAAAPQFSPLRFCGVLLIAGALLGGRDMDRTTQSA